MSALLNQGMGSLAPQLQSALSTMINAPDFSAMLTAHQVAELQTATSLSENELLLQLLPLAAAYSWTPISDFHVGAIAKGESGNVYFGANMEFSGAPLQQTIHAEQCAITHAWQRGESKLSAIWVNYSPCGHCRQFMNELSSGGQLLIHLPEQPARTLADYLPAAFGPADLQVDALLMERQDHLLPLPDNCSDPLILQAHTAARQSYAPYSHAPSAVALQLEDGTIITGPYAENAAYNPSLPPLQAALIMLNLSGYRVEAIKQAALVERQQAPFSQFSATQSTLLALGCDRLQHITV
ncbi:MAG: cytidine deaminase [Enterobacteriaceae bacterium]